MTRLRSLPRLLLLLVGTLVLGCSNSSTGPNASGHFLRFDANGTRVEFALEPALTAAFAHEGSQYSALLSGTNVDGSDASLELFSGAAITAKQYSGYGISGPAFVGVLITYQPTLGQVFTSVATPNSDAVVTVTDLSATEIKGTFSGTLKRNGQADIVVTNGEFSVRRAN